MGYSSVAAAKVVLQIDASETAWDAEIADCIPSADGLVDSFLKREGLTVPSPVPQNVADASAHYMAWLFRGRRDPNSAKVFLLEAEGFLQAYVDAEKEPYVGSV